MAKITPIVAAKIRALRLARGITLEDLAQRTGLGESQLRKMEAGQRQGSLNGYEAIAAEFGITLADLFAHEAPARRRGRHSHSAA